MANAVTLIDKKTGKKMYPVGSWLKYQHVFYNASDRAYNAMRDAEEGDDIRALETAEDWFNKVQEMLEKWDCNPQVKGIVYAVYEDYKIMKDIIGGYMWRHGGAV